jgi:hypothetical protein
VNSPRDLRSARAAAFTAVCVGLGVAAHTQMSGSSIPLWAVVVAGTGVFLPARLAARRECSITVISVLMLVAQAAMHVLFTVAQQAAPAMTTMQMPGMAMSGMQMHSMSMNGIPALPGDAPPVAAISLGRALAMSPAMLCAHAAAALLCAAALRRGEAALHLALRAARWVHHRLAWSQALRATAPLAQPSRLLGDNSRSDALRPRLTWSVLSRRGPPSLWCLT